jgi:hypothetical protein
MRHPHERQASLAGTEAQAGHHQDRDLGEVVDLATARRSTTPYWIVHAWR